MSDSADGFIGSSHQNASDRGVGGPVGSDSSAQWASGGLEERSEYQLADQPAKSLPAPFGSRGAPWGGRGASSVMT